jgi:transcription initiation factor TFIIH subunit 2
MPPHTSREALVIMGSLTTCDPGDINRTITQAGPIFML